MSVNRCKADRLAKYPERIVKLCHNPRQRNRRSVRWFVAKIANFVS